MTIKQAINEVTQELNWSPLHLAIAGEVGEGAARTWLSGQSTPSADNLLKLMAALPGLRERLGFDLKEAA